MATGYKAFKEKLDLEHKCPCPYMFKFIVPKSKKDAIRKLFPKQQMLEKRSKEGNYVSYTIEMVMQSSDEVIRIYEQAHKIEGIIAL